MLRSKTFLTVWAGIDAGKAAGHCRHDKCIVRRPQSGAALILVSASVSGQ